MNDGCAIRWITIRWLPTVTGLTLATYIDQHQYPTLPATRGGRFNFVVSIPFRETPVFITSLPSHQPACHRPHPSPSPSPVRWGVNYAFRIGAFHRWGLARGTGCIAFRPWPPLCHTGRAAVLFYMLPVTTNKTCLHFEFVPCVIYHEL